jgi:hypothetical protein
VSGRLDGHVAVVTGDPAIVDRGLLVSGKLHTVNG